MKIRKGGAKNLEVGGGRVKFFFQKTSSTCPRGGGRVIFFENVLDWGGRVDLIFENMVLPTNTNFYSTYANFYSLRTLTFSSLPTFTFAINNV